MVGGNCGPSPEKSANVECMTIGQCKKEVNGHLTICKVSDDVGVDSEVIPSGQVQHRQGLRKKAGSRSCRERNVACSCHRWGEVISCGGIPVPTADIVFFSRMAAKVRQQPVTDQDALAVEEQVNFCLARDSVLSSLQICHPIVVDQYDICALVRSKAVKKPSEGGAVTSLV